MLDKIKEIVEEIKETIEWLAAGCPKPVPIPIRIKDDHQKGNEAKEPNRR